MIASDTPGAERKRPRVSGDGKGVNHAAFIPLKGGEI